MKSCGINVPIVYDFNRYNFSITMQKLDGVTLNKAIHEGNNYMEYIRELGKIIGEMHNLLIAHGDLTPNNIIIAGNNIYLIDPSMGKLNCEIEDMADDLFLLTESFKSLYPNTDELENNFIDSYKKKSHNYEKVIDVLSSIRQRRRYV
jgi:N6-L-threonylcarbamoyladenine synthase/protein kinase Bud32